MTSARYSLSVSSVVVASAEASSKAIAYGDFEKGMVHIPSGSSLTTLTWHVSTSERGTYLPAYNSTGAITQTVAAGRSYPIPSDLQGAAWLKITGNTAGSVGLTLKD
jgi:hypothetical protein